MQRACSKSKLYSPPASLLDSSTYVLATRLERRSRTAQSNRTQGYVAHFRLLLGNWNIFTLSGKELELIETKKYHLDIVGDSFTKRSGSGIVDLDGG